MKGTCANCGEHKDVHSYRYSTNQKTVFYLCERCFWNTPATDMVELEKVNVIKDD